MSTASAKLALGVATALVLAALTEGPVIAGAIRVVAEQTSVTPQAVPTGTINWLQRASAAIARAEAGGVAAGGKLYVFGGQFSGVKQTLKSERYDPATDSWSPIRDLPELITHAPVVADGNTLWILGGYVGFENKDSSPRVWKYDIPSNTYTAGPALPAARGAGGAVIVGRSLHYLTGAVRKDSTGEVTKDSPDHWVLNLDGGTSWTSSTPVPNPRNHVAATALSGKIYLIGGQLGEAEATTPQKQVDAFDLATGRWTRMADLPVARGHISASTFVWNGGILVVGGSVAGTTGGVSSSSIYAYDPATNGWSARTDLPEALRSPVADLIDGRIVVSGGRSTRGPTDKTWLGSVVLTPSLPPPPAGGAGSWSSGPPLPVDLLDAGGAAIGAKIYVLGGKNRAGPQSALHIFDTATRSWTTGVPLPGPAVENPAVTSYDGKLYVVGGSTAAFTGAVDTAYRYDPATMVWTPLARMRSPRAGAASVAVGATIWVVGGMNGGASLNSTEAYDVAAGSWSTGPAMSVARDNPGAAAVGGRIYAFGGRTRRSDGTTVAATLDSTESLDPASGGWSARTAMPTGRRTMAVGVIGGKVIAAGGEKRADGTSFPQTEEYDPATNSWRTLAPMTTPRHGAAGAVVADRLHVIAGGTTGGSSYSRTHEIFALSVSPSPVPPPPPPPSSPAPTSPPLASPPAPPAPPAPPEPPAPTQTQAPPPTQSAGANPITPPSAATPATAEPGPVPPAITAPLPLARVPAPGLPAAPRNTGAPAVAGLARVGARVTCARGVWIGSASYTYQWLRDQAPVAGATAAVRTLDEVDYRRRIGCRVTATGAGGRRAIATSTSRIVALGSFGLVLRPVVFGQVRRGSRLVADRGRWSTTPATYTYQWRRGGVAIRGATAASYTLKRADVRRGVVVSVVVTVRRRAYAPAAAASLVVVGNRPGIVASTRGPIILRASRGTWSPAPTSFVYQWYRDGRVITGANAPAYRVTRSDRGRGLTVVVTVRRGRAVLGSAASVVTRIPRA